MTPVILSGGSGTRLWPVSRENYPKQFCEFYDRSFLETSIDRLVGFGEPRILTVESMRSLTLKILNDKKIPDDRIILEPMGRNTGPAIALLCHILSTQGQEKEVVGIFPSDHLIADEKEFSAVVELGQQVALEGEVVTIGIQPRYAATGFGYIETTEEFKKEDSQGRKAYSVKGYFEKPKPEVAEQYIATGRHHWSAGMFMFRVDVMIENFKKHLPEVWKYIEQVKPDLSNLKYMYANVESISFDYGIMEKLGEFTCIPCSIGWSDVGSWDEIARLMDEIPNLKFDSRAMVFNHDSHSNYVFSIKEKVVGVIGVDDLIVVDTPDAMLVTRRGMSQGVRQIVKQVKEQGLPQASDHVFEKRPWGGFETLSNGEEFKTKTITVDPGQQLSYQSHSKRTEHWIVVKGKAQVTIDDEVNEHLAGDYIKIPQGAKHRIGNPTSEPLVFVEVQTGTYFGEDDIVRYADDYSRV